VARFIHANGLHGGACPHDDSALKGASKAIASDTEHGAT